MSEVVMELTAEEQALIQQKREEQAAREEAERKQREAAEEKARREAKRIADALEGLKTNLLAADPEREVLFEKEDGTVCYLLDGREEQVYMEEHRTYHGSWSYRSRSAGFKYRLYGPINDYKERRYTKAATVLKKIKEAQAAAIARNEAKAARLSVKERAQAILEDRFPLADLTHENGYKYDRPYRYQPDKFVLKTAKGKVEYTYQEDYNNPGEILLQIWKVSPTSEVQDEVAMVILDPTNDA